MKSNIDEELHGRSLGWICPKCGRVHAPFIMECFYCNDKLKSEEEIIHYPFVTITDENLKYTTSSEFDTNLDSCVITPPWSQDYSKYKSEVTTDTYRCGQNVTTTNGYFQELEKYPTNLDLSIHKYSSQEQLQESLDGLNKELENLGTQPTSLDELNNIKNTLNQDSNDDMWPTEQEVKAHLKYIKEQTETENNINDNYMVRLKKPGRNNIIDDDMSYWKCSRCGKVHLVFPEDGCECGAPLEYLTYVI